MNLILSYLRPYRVRVYFGLFIKSIATFMELLLPLLLAYILDDIIPTKNLSMVIFFGFLMLLCAVLGYGGNVYANRHASKVSALSIEALRNDTFEKIMYFSNTTIDDFKIPSLISRMTSDTYHIYRMFNVVQRIAIRAPIILLGSIVIMLTLDAYLAVVLISLLPIIAGIIYFISKQSIPYYDRLQKELDGLIRVVRESIGGIRVIKSLSKEQEETKKFEAINESVAKKEKTAGYLVSILNPIMNLVLNLGLVVIIYIGAIRVSKGLSTTGGIIAFLSYFTLILNAFLAMNRIFLLISKASASASRIAELLNTTTKIDVVETTSSLEGYQIEFDGVGFSYRGDEKLQLENISFQIKPRDIFGIIGSTGSGKSTIAQLLLRFYDVTSGEIRIEGKSIQSYPLEELRRKFGVVFQHDVLFADTVKENIRFGREMEVEDVMEAASLAQASEFIHALGDHFEEKVQRGGANFSGGQRQRMLIARALADRPDIVIFDDASSALDYKTDADLRIALRGRNVTTILIAQRISSVMQANQILVLEEGKAVGLGSHEQLLATCETYQDLYALQLGGEEA